ncbi:MAG: response regulator, partial [Anaerolineae bacterium]|nr:response regulator [Anaerolineae bacterium]
MKKVLIVEDNASLRKDVVEMLSYEGFEVYEAENGRIGVDIARRYLPDLIICDIMMPELD